MASTIKESAQQEVNHLRHVTAEGAKSGAYLYPLRVRTD